MSEPARERLLGRNYSSGGPMSQRQIGLGDPRRRSARQQKRRRAYVAREFEVCEASRLIEIFPSRVDLVGLSFNSQFAAIASRFGGHVHLVRIARQTNG